MIKITLQLAKMTMAGDFDGDDYGSADGAMMQELIDGDDDVSEFDAGESSKNIKNAE